MNARSVIVLAGWSLASTVFPSAHAQQGNCAALNQIIGQAGEGFRSLRGPYDRDTQLYDAVVTLEGATDCTVDDLGDGDATFSCSWFYRQDQGTKQQSDAAVLTSFVRSCFPGSQETRRERRTVVTEFILSNQGPRRFRIQVESKTSQGGRPILRLSVLNY
jgi:hypothetical protein